MKSLAGLGRVERVGDRILQEIDKRQRGGETELWVTYTQGEIGMMTNATQVASLVRRKIEKAGHEVVDGEGGQFGDDVRLLVRCGNPPR